MGLPNNNPSTTANDRSNNGNTPAERQIATSNSTFNMFVGGRQPSWLTGASPVAPVQTTQKSKSPARPPNGGNTEDTRGASKDGPPIQLWAQPQISTEPQRAREIEDTRGTSTDRGAVSTSTSPFLANNMPPPKPQQVVANAPSPPLTPSTTIPPTSLASYVPEPVSFRGGDVPINSPIQPLPDTSPSRKRNFPADGLATSSKRPRLGITFSLDRTIAQQRQEERQQRQSISQISADFSTHEQPNGEHRGQLEYQRQQPAGDVVMAHAQRQARVAMEQQKQQHLFSSQTRARTQVSSQQQNSTSIPQTFHSGTPQPEPRRLSGPHPSNAAFNQSPPKQMVHMNTAFSMPGQHDHQQAIQINNQSPQNLPFPPYVQDKCLHLMDSYVQGRGGLSNISRVAVSRLRVLEHAIREDDWFFLFLHHIVSEARRGNPLPKAISGIRHFVRTLSILNSILGSLNFDDQNMIVWFANFPYAFSNIRKYSWTWHSGLSLLNQLVPSVAEQWPDLQKECSLIQCPPAVYRLVGHLRLRSRTLVRLFFTAARRLAWQGNEEDPRFARICDQANNIRERAWQTYIHDFANYRPELEISSYVHLRQQFQRLYPANVQLQQQRQPNLPLSTYELQHQVRLAPASAGLSYHGSPLSSTSTSPFFPQLESQVTPGSAGPSSNNSPASPLIALPRFPPVGVFGVTQPPTLMSSATALPPRQAAPPVSIFSVTQSSTSSSFASALPARRLSSQQHAIPSNHHPVMPRGDQSGQGRQRAPIQSQLLPDGSANPPPQPAVPNWQTSALHQAHLRDPILARAESGSQGLSTPLLYQIVVNFPLPPKRLLLGSLVHDWTFMVSEEDFSNVAATQRIPGQRSERLLSEKSLQYRLRCSKIRGGNGSIKEEDWVVSETSFPIYMYLFINGLCLEIRRKLHFGKDYPIDLTELIVVGENKLEICLNTTRDDNDPSNYALAVETVGVKSEEMVVQECKGRFREAGDVLSSIKSSLDNVAAGDDDDLVMLSGNVTIDLIDPITQSNTFELPVRGKNCAHWSCFDLGAFLQGRTREKPHFPSLVDVWRCPICRGDARPQNLILDGFVLDVIKKLKEQGKSKTRAIHVEADGSWRPRKEKDLYESGKRSASRQSIQPIASTQFNTAQGSPPLQLSSRANHSTTEAPPQAPTAKEVVAIVDLPSDSDAY